MVRFTSLFSQLLSLIPHNDFHRAVRDAEGECPEYFRGSEEDKGTAGFDHQGFGCAVELKSNYSLKLLNLFS